jgi:aspartyl-tRNA(Asn)/glutamyl-tRNA(Gln) amidotransferase subunit A
MLAATPRLAALGLEAMVGEDPSDPISRPAPADWHAVPRAPLRAAGLRLGLPRPVRDATMEPAIRAAWDEAATRARALGADVGDIGIAAWEPSAARRAGLLLIEAEAAALHPHLIEDATAASPGFRAALAYGRDAGTTRLMRAIFRLAELRAAMLRALDGCDALLLPTAPQRAFPHGTPAPADQADFCAPANIAGLPAIAFPWPADDGGLPCSVQLIGRPHAEAMLVGLAEALTAP